MTKFIALLALIVCVFAIMLGNFWFTYGIWPKSWASFTLFFLLFTIVHSLIDAVKKDL